MVLCHRKGMCHISYEKCVDLHDVERCSGCPNFLKILELEEEAAVTEELKRVERRQLKRKRIKGHE